MTIKLPADYNNLSFRARRQVREEYIRRQNNLCYWCEHILDGEPPMEILNKQINWKLFPSGFLKHPVHLQHDHHSGLTEGAVHAYCNAVMWQYHGR